MLRALRKPRSKWSFLVIYLVAFLLTFVSFYFSNTPFSFLAPLLSLIVIILVVLGLWLNVQFFLETYVNFIFEHYFEADPDKVSKINSIKSDGLKLVMITAALIGLLIFLFAIGYSIADDFFPGSNIRIITESGTVSTFPDFFYFSGVTFFTIGYGDMVPLGVSRLIALLESLTGFLLSSVMVGFAVSILAARYVEKKHPKQTKN
jgi:hypothetical protein